MTTESHGTPSDERAEVSEDMRRAQAVPVPQDRLDMMANHPSRVMQGSAPVSLKSGELRSMAEEITASRRALSLTGSGRGVKVKALCWERWDRSFKQTAVTIRGRYEVDIWNTDTKAWRWYSSATGLWNSGSGKMTEADAKAAAQSHYDGVILSALEPTPTLKQTGSVVAWPLQKALTYAEQYSQEYEFDSDEGQHVPTEVERMVMLDMLNGLFSEPEFISLVASEPITAREVTDLVTRLRAELTLERYEAIMSNGWDKAIRGLLEEYDAGTGIGDGHRLLAENWMMEGKDELIEEAADALSTALLQVEALTRALERIAESYDGPWGTPNYVPLADLGKELRRRQKLATEALRSPSKEGETP